MSTPGTTVIEWIAEGTTLYPEAYCACTPFYRWLDNSEEAIIYGIQRVRLVGINTPEIGEEVMCVNKITRFYLADKVKIEKYIWYE